MKAIQILLPACLNFRFWVDIVQSATHDNLPFFNGKNTCYACQNDARFRAKYFLVFTTCSSPRN